jgi:hypothetical protein
MSAINTEILQALEAHGPLTVREIYENTPSATERKQVSKAVHSLSTSDQLKVVGKMKGDDARNDTGTPLNLYDITDKGRERIGGQKPTPEAELIRRVREAEPVQPWEVFDASTDPIVADINTIQFSAPNELFRTGREHAGRLRYLAERLESIRTTEGNNIAANLRETADLIDQLVPSEA